LFIGRIIDDNILSDVFIISESIIHVAKYNTHWIFIQVSIIISFRICKGSFFYMEPEITAHNDIRWTLYKWTNLILNLSFDHAIVYIACSIGYFKFNHNWSCTNIATRKWNTRTMYCSAISAVDRRYSSRLIIYTCAFCSPVEINATVHPSGPERHRSAIIITAIIKNCSRYQGYSTRSIIGQADNSMLITIDHRYDIIDDSNMETAAAAISTFIRHSPGNSIGTQLKSINHIVIAKRHYRTSIGRQAIFSYSTACIVCIRFRHTDIGIAIPEICSYY